MFDINFYMKIFDLKYELMGGKTVNREYILKEFENLRSENPVIYNLETTNTCNMLCEMCPRTTQMTRSIETIDMETFKRIVDQIKPFTAEEWEKWETFVKEKYGILKDDMSENHFFLYIIPKVIVLHGYGDPLLDKNMPEKVKILSDKNFFSYFSCNPANINIDRTEEMFKNGLDYIKYSVESVDDKRHREVRGDASNFTDSYNKILQLLDMKKRNQYKATIVITMLDLDEEEHQKEEFEKLREAFKGLDVYIYLKSQDQKWYKGNEKPTSSLHWTEFCQFPWTSITIKSNGEVAECVEDFNNEIVLGDVKKESLADIWNGAKYKKFREDHFDLTKGIKCTQECDMKLIGNMKLS